MSLLLTLCGKSTFQAEDEESRVSRPYRNDVDSSEAPAIVKMVRLPRETYSATLWNVRTQMNCGR